MFQSNWRLNAFVALFILTTTVNTLLTNFTEEWYLPLFGLLMFGFGFGLIKLGKAFSKNDKRWLKEQISNAIDGNTLP